MLTTLAIEARATTRGIATRFDMARWRSEAPPALIGIALLLFLAAHNASAWLALPATIALGRAALSTGLTIPNKWVFLGGLVMAASFTLGAFSTLRAPLWNPYFVAMSILVMEFAWLGLWLYCCKVSDRVWGWIAAGTVVQAVVLLAAKWTHLRDGGFQSAGLTNLTSVASGILDVGIVYLIFKGRWYLTLPLWFGLLVTGQRLGFWVAVVLSCLMGVRRIIAWRDLGTIALFILIYVAVTGGAAQQRALFYGQPPWGAKPQADIVLRLTEWPSHRPSLSPDGYTSENGAHNAPWRVWYHGGIVGVGAFVLQTLYGLWKDRGGVAWWMRLLLLGLGTLDFYVVMPAFSLIWWLALPRNNTEVSIALPPFLPPKRPSATAAAWRSSGVGSGACTMSGASTVPAPVAKATVDAALWFMSRGRFG